MIQYDPKRVSWMWLQGPVKEKKKSYKSPMFACVVFYDNTTYILLVPNISDGTRILGVPTLC